MHIWLITLSIIVAKTIVFRDDSDTDHDEEANAVIPKFIRDGFKMEDLGIEEENLFKEKQNEPIYLQKLENEYYNKPVIDEFTKFGGAPYQV